MASPKDEVAILRAELENLPPQTYYRDVGTIPNPRMDDNLYSSSKSGEIGVRAAEITLEAADDVFFSAQQEADRAKNEAASAAASASTAAQQASTAKNEADRADDAADRAEAVAGFDGLHNTLVGRDAPNAHDASAISYSGEKLSDFLDQLGGGIGVRPTLRFDFANQGYLDPRIEFTRASKDWDSQGREYEIDEPVLTDKGLWVSGARTNSFLNNTDMLVWSRQNCTALKTGEWFEFTRTAEGSPSRPYTGAVPVTSGSVRTVSIDAEEGTAQYMRIFARVTESGAVLEPYANFDLQTGEVTAFNDRGDTDFSAGSVVNEDGSRRFYITFNTKDSTSVGAFFNISDTPTGNGGATPAGVTFKLRNPNFTESARLSPNIPTGSSAVTVDSNPLASQDGVKTREWTISSIAYLKNIKGNQQSIFSIYESGQHRIRLLLEADGNLAVIANAPSQPSLAIRTPFIELEETKVAVSYDGEIIAFCYNGTLFTGLIDGLDLRELPIQIGSYNKSAFLGGYAREFNVYNRALTPAQLQELTS